MPETTLTCPKCGKTGKVTKQLTGGAVAATLLVMEGLNPDGCDGCRDIMHSRGYTMINMQAAGPGAWSVTSAEN